MSWQDMATGLRALRIAFFIDAAYAGTLRVTAVEFEDLMFMAEEHVTRLKADGFINLSNHGIAQVFGLELICRILGDRPACKGGREHAVDMFDKILVEAYTDDGIHREHSPTYHLFTTRWIERFGPEKLDHLHAIDVIKKAKGWAPWMSMPNGSMAPVGDSSGEAPTLETAQNLHELSDGRSFAVGDFTASGYAIVRTTSAQSVSQSMLFVTGMAYNSRHKHADDLSFVLFENGRPVLTEGGKYGYNNDDWRKYVLSAAAHNTISLDEREIPPTDVEWTGSLLSPVEISGDTIQNRREGLAPRPFSTTANV